MELDIYIEGLREPIHIAKINKWIHDRVTGDYKFLDDNGVYILVVPENRMLAIHRVNAS